MRGSFDRTSFPDIILRFFFFSPHLRNCPDPFEDEESNPVHVDD